MSRMNLVLGTQRIRKASGAYLMGALLAGCGGGSGGYGSSNTAPQPTVSFTVAPTSIVLGQSATLSWSTTNTSSCTASNGWSGTESLNGTSVVTPAAAGTVTFTLTCGGGANSGSSAKSAVLNVAPATAYSITSLVADSPGTGALTQDAHLVNPWGLAFGPTTPAWVANNRTGTATLYDGNGKAQLSSSPLVVSFAPSQAGTAFAPTGIVFNPSSDFIVSGTTSGPARFLFAGEGGMLAGWSPAVDRTHAITTYTDAGGAVYKGIALANNGAGNFLYATDFHGNKVDVFDSQFHKQAGSATAFPFADPNLPAGYAPFGIGALATGNAGATQIYVTYAKQSAPDNHDELTGAGLGLIDVFDTSGRFVSRLVNPGGSLNAPWGLALAPGDFGTLRTALLVGNFGDGKINAFAPNSGTVVGAVTDSHGNAVAQPGLWGIAFGNDVANQPHNTLFFSAGGGDQSSGAFGRIDAGAAPVLNAAPVVTVTAPTGNVSGTVALSATVQDPIAIATVEFFAAGQSIGVASVAPFTVQWDSTTVANGTVALNAKATDVDGNVGVGVTEATVSNGAAPTTLADIQASVFTPICSGCHSGSNPPDGALPGSQNLTAGNSFSNLVLVASHEQPTLLRVKPGDPDNSYLIRKLEGATGISGSRMPLGGPFLDQPTIDKIKSWILSGAANN